MEIVLRLHPALRLELRKVAETSHAYREMVAGIAAEVEALVARHGASIHCATIHLHGTPLDTAGCAASAHALRPGGIAVVDVDPLGAALPGAAGRLVILAQRGPDGGSPPRHRRHDSARNPSFALGVFNVPPVREARAAARIRERWKRNST